MIQTLVVSKEPTVDTAASGETSQLRRSTMGNETDFGSIDTSKHSFGAHVYRRRSSLQVYRTFLGEFYASTGGWLLIVLGFLISLGIGSLIGVVPRVATQRFAEINYGLEKGILCSSFSSDDLPLACVKAAAYAQSAASYSALARNLMGLFLNSFAGSYSDTHGRRGVQIICILLITFSPISFWLIQVCDRVHPIWYYFLESFAGVISFFSIAFTQLSDIMPPGHRAASYGLYFGSFMAGIAIAPFLATLLSHVQIAIFSSAIRIVALMIAVFFMPETLPTESRLAAVAAAQAAKDDQRDKGTSITCKIVTALLQPLLKMTILQRSSSLLLVAFGAFAGKMVVSADVTLFFYYVESNLGVTDKDVAWMMFTAGVCGVLIQAGFFKYLISLLGERRLLIASFCSGTIHNLIYGLAPSKEFLYVGLCLSAFTNLNSALLASVASRNVARTEQGQVQGALFGLISLAEGIGPISFNYVSRNWHTFGPGTMFVVGAMLYGLGMIAVALVPPKGGAMVAGMEQEEDEDDASSQDFDEPLGEREVLLP